MQNKSSCVQTPKNGTSLTFSCGRVELSMRTKRRIRKMALLPETTGTPRLDKRLYTSWTSTANMSYPRRLSLNERRLRNKHPSDKNIEHRFNNNRLTNSSSCMISCLLSSILISMILWPLLPVTRHHTALCHRRQPILGRHKPLLANRTRRSFPGQRIPRLAEQHSLP